MTPVFSFRLPSAERENLVEMSKVFGAPNPRAFLREMVGAMCSGDGERVRAFNTKLIHAVGEQLVLRLHGPLPGKVVSKAKKVPKRRKGRRGTT